MTWMNPTTVTSSHTSMNVSQKKSPSNTRPPGTPRPVVPFCEAATAQPRTPCNKYQRFWQARSGYVRGAGTGRWGAQDAVW